MKTLRGIGACMALGLGVGAACTIEIGSLNDTGENAPAVPGSSEGVSGQPPLDAARQARQEEVDRYITDVVYQGATVLYSVALPSGDTLDFIDRNTLMPISQGLPVLPVGADLASLPAGIQMGISELEQSAELLEWAAAATPFRRPTFWPYVMGEVPQAQSIQDYLARFQVGGAPSEGTRLYAGLVSPLPNRGVSGFMSQFSPKVYPSSFSLIEFVVACPAEGPAQEMIGIAISVDRVNGFGPQHLALTDTQPRMHIEYARAANGPNPYVWDGMDGQFVPNPFRRHQPGEIVEVSKLGETSIEHLLAIFQSLNSDWWIAFNGDLLGYYPANLFKMLKSGACRAAWYGENYNPKPGTANYTEMGSGLFAEAGLFNAAHIRNPLYYDQGWLAVKPKDEFYMSPVKPACYNRSALIHLGPPWDSSFVFLGGLGSKNPECVWP